MNNMNMNNMNDPMMMNFYMQFMQMMNNANNNMMWMNNTMNMNNMNNPNMNMQFMQMMNNMNQNQSNNNMNNQQFQQNQNYQNNIQNNQGIKGAINLQFTTDISSYNIVTNYNESLGTVIGKYISMTNDINVNMYIFNGKKINESLTVGEAGLYDGSLIHVVPTKNIIGAVFLKN